MKQATFRIIHFTKHNQYVGLAWNYDVAVLVSTTPQESYTAARMQLQQDCDIVKVTLQWFDGLYTCDGNTEQLIPARVPSEWTDPQPSFARLTN